MRFRRLYEMRLIDFDDCRAFHAGGTALIARRRLDESHVTLRYVNARKQPNDRAVIRQTQRFERYRNRSTINTVKPARLIALINNYYVICLLNPRGACTRSTCKEARGVRALCPILTAPCRINCHGGFQH
jgi:hypothetical protein